MAPGQRNRSLTRRDPGPRGLGAAWKPVSASPRTVDARSPIASGARTLKLVCLVILWAAIPVAAQNPTWTLSRWEDAWRSAASSPTRRALLIRAAPRVGTQGSLLFLRSLLRGWPRDENARIALQSLLHHPLADAKATILALYQKTPGVSAKAGLIQLLVRESKRRTEGLDLLEKEIRRHAGSPLGSSLLRILPEFFDENDPLRPDATSFLADVYGETDEPAVRGDIWRVARRLPPQDRLPFWIAAIEEQDRLHAGEAALEILRRDIPGAEDLVVDAWITDLDRAEASGMRRVLTAAARPSLVLKLAGRVEELAWSDLRRLFHILQAVKLDKLEPFFFSLLSEDEPKSRALAVLYFRDHRRADLVRHLERIAQEETLLPATWAALALADATGNSRPWDRIRRRLASGGLQQRWTRLLNLADAGLEGATARAWLAESLERHKDWRLLTALLPLAGTAALPDFADRVDVFLTHRRWQVRLAAIEALVRDGRREILPQLARAVGFDHYRLARKAADGLAYLTGKRFGVAPTAWEAWIAKLPQSWVPLRLPIDLQDSQANDRYGPRFYGLDLRSNRIVFVCDISGSMDGGKLEALKLELRRAISSLSPPGAYNVLLFSDSVTSFFGGIRTATPSRKQGTVDRLKDVRAAGGTNLWGGLEKAFADKQADTFVVLTDGQPSSGRITQASQILEAVRQRNLYRRIQIHALFVTAAKTEGVDASSDFMRRLADENEGSFLLVSP